MSNGPKSLLLVGFGAFGTYRANSSHLLTERLAGRHVGRYMVHRHILPALIPDHTDYGYVLLDEAERAHHHAIICLGMASSSPGFKIECATFNRVSDPKYCPHTAPGTRISHEYPFDHRRDLDMRRWPLARFADECAKLPSPIEVATSTDPGGFCCNHLMWQLSAAQDAYFCRFQHLPWLFMHIPCCAEALPEGSLPSSNGKVVLSLDTLEMGLRRVIELTHI